MRKKFTSTIAGASIFISAIGLLSRGLGFFREMIFASDFGLETEFDLYLVGAVLPVTINSIILYIGQNYFIPKFQKLNSDDPREGQIYFKQSFIAFIVVGILIALLLYLTSDIIIDFYMHSASLTDKQIASNIFILFLITIPLSAGVSILSALLQSFYEFKYPAIAILFLNVCIILMLVLFADRFGVFIIPVGYLIGTFLQFSYLMFRSSKHMRLNVFKLNFYSDLSGPIVNSSIVIIILIEAMSQLHALFDRYFYSEVTSGGIASLNYALIIWFLPISILSISLATAVFPVINKEIIDNSNTEMERIYNESVSINVFLFIPLTFILFFYGDTIIKIFFERGKFVEESTLITFNVLKLYSISLVFYSVYAVLNKIFFSINRMKSLLLITVVGVSIKLILNFVLIDLQQNGLALSTSISFIFFFIASYVILNRELRIKCRYLFFKDIVFHLTNGAICILLINIISNHFFLRSLITETISVILFFVLYVINVLIVKHNAYKITARVLSHLNFGKIIYRG
jgi:putative peptidoglycan lipid II flippase